MSKKRTTSDLFVSYATEDLDLGVGDIFLALFEVGVTSIWMDRFVIEAGESIPSAIDQGLQNTRYLLPIITDNFFKKDWTRMELDAVRFLQKPTIPIWIDVRVADVKEFSPTLAAQKAIIYDANPYDVAEQIGKILLKNKRTHFYKGKEKREESELFWRMVWVYMTIVVKGEDPATSEFFLELDKMTNDDNPTALENVRDALDFTDDDLHSFSKELRARAESIGNTVSDDELAHLLCGFAKRQQPWFPHEQLEHDALEKVGMAGFV